MFGSKGEVCPEMEHPIEEDSRACPMCGSEVSPLVESCPNCGSWIGLPEIEEVAVTDEALPASEYPSESTAGLEQDDEPVRPEAEPGKELVPAAIPAQIDTDNTFQKSEESLDQSSAELPLANVNPLDVKASPLPSEQLPDGLSAQQSEVVAEQPEGILPISPQEPLSETLPAGSDQASESKPAVNRALVLGIVPLGLVVCCIASGLLGYLWSSQTSPESTQDGFLPTLTEPIKITQSPSVTFSPIPTATRTKLPTATFTPVFTYTATRRPIPTAVPSDTPITSIEWEACPNTLLSRLHVGEQGYISYTPPLANNVRKQAGTDGLLIGKLQPGEELIVVDGPECENNWVWWLVRSQKTGLQGWTAEGDQDGYWIVPIN